MFHRTLLRAVWLSTPLILAGLAVSAGSEPDPLRAELNGQTIELDQVVLYHCHDGSYPTIRCFHEAGERDADADLESGPASLVGSLESVSAATTQAATFYVTFYQHASYGGSSLTASQPIDNLGVYGWNDAISSFKSLYGQRPKWWANADYGIPSWHWPAGAEVSNVGSGANDTFSAVRNVP